MSSCCQNNQVSLPCPQCKQLSKRVEMRTLYHQVKFPENLTLVSDSYYFCATKECAVGYFSDDGNKIPKQHFRSYQDLMDDKLCYCFDIDSAQYQAALLENKAEPIKNFVLQKTKSGDCACETRNPSGQCCLANFKHLEKSRIKGN